MSEELLLKFSFDGRLADEHRLDFYEAARFQYGAARLIYTIDRFIETGKVPNRVSPRAISSRYRIAPAINGSWEQEIFQSVIGGVLAAPVIYGFAYVYRLLFPAQKRAASTANLLENLNSGADSNEIKLFLETYQNTQENELIELCIQKLTKHKAGLTHHAEVNEALQSLFELKAQRLKSNEFERLMGGVSTDDAQRLIKKTRPQIAEIGYPLSKSANSLSILDAANDNPTNYSLSHKDIISLSSNIYEEILQDFSVVIKSFDKETGWGKLRLLNEDRSNDIFSFLVRKNLICIKMMF